MADDFVYGVGSTTDPIDFVISRIDPDTQEVTAVNLTGATAITLRMKPNYGDGAVKSFSLVDRVSVVSATAGQIRFSPAADDLDIDDKSYRCYFKITLSTGKEMRAPSSRDFTIALIENF